MDTVLKKRDSNMCDLTVELGKEDLEKYVKSAEEQLLQDFEVKGFRKGKAPRDVMRKHVGDAKILSLGLEMAVDQSLAEAIRKEGLDVLSAGGLKMIENSGQKLVYSVSLTLFPNVDISQVGNFKVNHKEVAVADPEIDQALSNLRTSRAVFIDKDSDAQNGDRVEVDFEVTNNGQAIEGGISKDHPLTIGSKSFIPGFEDQLIGMKKDEEKMFSLIAPADYFHKDIAGKKLDFRVLLKKVQKVELPELNDTFAQNIGKFGGLQQLRDSIREGLLEEKKIKEQQRVRLEILDELIKRAKIDVPKDLVNQRLEGMVQDFDRDLHGKGMELSLYLAHIGKNQDELKKDWYPNAEKQVKISLVLKKISRTQNIIASPKDVEDEFNRALESLTISGGITPEQINIEALRDGVTQNLINEKTLKALERDHAA